MRINFTHFELPITLDGFGYFLYAQDLSINKSFPVSALANNGWPTFLSIFFMIFRSDNFLDYMGLQRMITIILSSITAIPVFFICRKIFDERYSILGVILFVFEPRVLQNSGLGITDTLYVFLGANSLLLFLSNNRKANYCAFVLAGFSSLVRSEGLFFMIPLTIMFLYKIKEEKNRSLKILFVICIFILSISPLELVRIEKIGYDSLFQRVINEGSRLVDSAQPSTESKYVVNFGFRNIETPIKLIGWAMIPNFIFLLPIGLYSLFRNTDFVRKTIIFTLIVMMIPAIYAMSWGSDLRYLLFVYPILCLISLFTLKKIFQRFHKELEFLILFGVIIIMICFVFTELRSHEDYHEFEAWNIARDIFDTNLKINNYGVESGYLRVVALEKSDRFPESSEKMNFMKIVDLRGLKSSDQLLIFGKKLGLTHLVIDDSNNPKFLDDIYNNELSYPYLLKIYDSTDHGFTYHVKMFKINYDYETMKLKH